LVPDSPPFDAVTEGGDGSRYVGSQRVRKFDGEEVVHVSGGDLEVERVGSGPRDAHEHLARAGGGLLDVLEGRGVSVAGDLDGFHWLS